MKTPAWFLMRILNLTLAIEALTSFVMAESLVTDRPDATESSVVVGPNVVQLETGIAFIDEDSENTMEWFGTLVRLGLNEKWEARLAWDGAIDTDSDGPKGIGDAAIGFKYFIQPGEGAMPQTALIVHTSIPIGKDGLTTNAYDPSFLFSFSHTTSETSSLGYNLGASLESGLDAFGNRTTLASLDYSLSYGFGITENVGSYIEVFGSRGLSARESPIHLDGGFTYLLNEDTQFDLFAGIGLNADAPDLFIGMGFSKRWP